MPFTYRDKPKFSDRFRGKSGEEILNELKSDLDPDKRMFFESPWRTRPNNSSGFRRGFPFDDDRNRTDIRTYLDDIAARHPEFADQLKEPPWSEDFVNSPFGRKRRGSNSGREENIRSETSGSNQAQFEQPPTEVKEPRPNLSNFGYRNTVPLGPGAVAEEEERRQRSMSAPPDNRVSDKSKRFVTKCEIPVMHDPMQESTQAKADVAGKVGQEFNQQRSNNAPNVRVIPIQVEGRDTPVVNAGVDTSTNFGGETYRDASFEARLPRDFGSYQRHSPRFAHKERSATPPQYQYAPQFQQYAPPQQNFMPPQQQPFAPHQQFVPPQHQQQPFGHQQQPFGHQQQPFGHQQQPFGHQQQPFGHQQQQQPFGHQQPHSQKPPAAPPQHHQQHQQQQKHQQQQQQPHPQQQQQHPQAPKPPQGEETVSKPPPPPQPKPDPIEKVQAIQKEVEELMKQVESFDGKSRSDKQYLMLDELLTRQLLLLDNIETEGKENVRQARKDTIRSIQRCISTLENKVPLLEDKNPGEESNEVQGEEAKGDETAVPQAMEVDQTKENTPVNNQENQNMEVDDKEKKQEEQQQQQPQEEKNKEKV